MTVNYDWKGLLDRWNADLLRCPRIRQSLPSEVIRSGWLGHPSASGEQLGRLESRLGTTLPPSYRQFLELTNGWRTLGGWTGALWSTDQIDWHRNRHQDLIDAWLIGRRSNGPPMRVSDAEYLVYGDAQRPENLRDEYLLSALEISDLGDSAGEVYLLNPQTVSRDGEWEAWFFAPWHPGAVRYPSFWELMQAEYSLFTC